jgi:adenylyltransferase/sulfurtransferase
VLGPLPGTFGALQSLLTLKILLGIPGQLEGHLLLMDFMNFSSVKIQAPRRAGCTAPRCALIHELPPEDAAIEMRFASLSAAAERRLELIDIRSAEEFAAAPTPARHIPMPALLANPQLLSPGVEYLFICASGKRSLTAARAMRQSGLKAHSLAGGLRALSPLASAAAAAPGEG